MYRSKEHYSALRRDSYSSNGETEEADETRDSRPRSKHNMLLTGCGGRFNIRRLISMFSLTQKGLRSLVSPSEQEQPSLSHLSIRALL